MPLTNTASWPSLVGGRKAKASEVELKFDWLEGDLWPMQSGTTANLTYNLGASDKQWKGAWMGGINPTSTAAGVAIGKELAGSSTCLDMSAMKKAMLLPIVTTAEQGSLTATAGMIVYNSTNSRMERYEGGQWLGMNNPYGLVAKVKHNNISNAYAEAFNVSGSGVIRKLSVNGVVASQIYLVVDGVTLNTLTTTGISSGTIGSVMLSDYTTGTETLGMALGVSASETNIAFKSSCVVYTKNGAGNTLTTNIIYEAA